MADIAEDESAGIDQKPYPRQGEQWRHVKTGHVVRVIGLHMIWSNHEKGENVWLPWLHFFIVKSKVSERDQCVLFIGSDDKNYVREINNFLERFERVE